MQLDTSAKHVSTTSRRVIEINSESPTHMSDKKQEKDFTSEVNELLPEADDLVKVWLYGLARI